MKHTKCFFIIGKHSTLFNSGVDLFNSESSRGNVLVRVLQEANSVRGAQYLIEETPAKDQGREPAAEGRATTLPGHWAGRES